MISPARSRSPNAASTSATWRTISIHSPVLACGSVVRANSAPRRMMRQVRPSDAAAGARRRRTAEHHVTLIDVAGRGSRSGSSGGVGKSTISMAGEMPAIAARGGLAVGAGRHVAADMHRDLRLGHRLRPAGERYACRPTRRARSAVRKPTSGAGDLQALLARRRAEADLPAERPVAAGEPLAPQLELRAHAAHDARILPGFHRC